MGLQPKEELLQRFTEISKLLQQEGYTPEHLFFLISANVPAAIFSSGLSPLQSLVKYLIEKRKMSLEEIASKIKRSYRAVWGAYNASKDRKADFPDQLHYLIPLSAFNDKLSVLETVVSVLRHQYHMRFSTIAKLLDKDPRTVWTVYHRAKKK